MLSNEKIMTDLQYSKGQLPVVYRGGQLLSSSRFGQPHMLFFIFVMLILILMMAFERDLFDLVKRLSFFKKHYVEPFSRMNAITEDFYKELKPFYLVREFERSIATKK